MSEISKKQYLLNELEMFNNEHPDTPKAYAVLKKLIEKYLDENTVFDIVITREGYSLIATDSNHNIGIHATDDDITLTRNPTDTKPGHSGDNIHTDEFRHKDIEQISRLLKTLHIS